MKVHLILTGGSANDKEAVSDILLGRKRSFLSLEFILDERFRKLYQLQPLPEFDGTRKKKIEKTITSYGGNFNFYHILWIVSRVSDSLLKK